MTLFQVMSPLVSVALLLPTLLIPVPRLSSVTVRPFCLPAWAHHGCQPCSFASGFKGNPQTSLLVLQTIEPGQSEMELTLIRRMGLLGCKTDQEPLPENEQTAEWIAKNITRINKIISYHQSRGKILALTHP